MCLLFICWAVNSSLVRNLNAFSLVTLVTSAFHHSYHQHIKTYSAATLTMLKSRKDAVKMTTQAHIYSTTEAGAMRGGEGA